MNRRTLLSGLPLAALAACTTSTTGSITTVTVNVAQVDAWAQAFENAGNLILGLPGMNTALGGSGPIISVAIAAVATDVAAFDKATAGSATYSFDKTSVPSMLLSILTDGRSILTTAQAALGTASKTGTVATYINALATIVSLFEATVGVMPAAAIMGAKPMSEADALAALKVSK